MNLVCEHCGLKCLKHPASHKEGLCSGEVEKCLYLFLRSQWQLVAEGLDQAIIEESQQQLQVLDDVTGGSPASLNEHRRNYKSK
jgi:hypothetical protein